jgi:hypothetical protein
MNHMIGDGLLLWFTLIIFGILRGRPCPLMNKLVVALSVALIIGRLLLLVDTPPYLQVGPEIAHVPLKKMFFSSPSINGKPLAKDSKHGNSFWKNIQASYLYSNIYTAYRYSYIFKYIYILYSHDYPMFFPCFFPKNTSSILGFSHFRVQFMRFDLLCMMAGLLGLLILLFCHLCLEETLVKKAESEAMAALPGGILQTICRKKPG